VAGDRRTALRDRDRRRVYRRVDRRHAPGRGDAVRGLHLVTVAAKQRYRAGTPVPITVRLPSGGGFSGGPFHSQNPESSFAHIPGLKVVCPATPADAKGLIATAIEDPNPVLYFEHKHLYRRIKDEVPDERYTVPFGEARVHQEGEDVTVVTWGAMVYTAAEAAKKVQEEDELSVEILDLRTLIPWDKKTVLSSVEKTSKALVLHEDTRTGGFGAEIVATIAEEAFENLDAPVKRITAPDTPVPFSPPLEQAFIPQVEDVVAGLRDLGSY
jgi:2-oxoisovalerate dehydrogenase E1 component beta subunit